jgi:hypothetical protein
MKKYLLAVSMILMLTILLTGCGGKEEPKIDITKMTAFEIASLFVDAGYPIGEIVKYDESTDLNHLLGRPGAYTSKVNFEDTRLKQITLIEAPPTGGTFEVFENEKDAQNRINYLHQIVGTSGPFFQYEYYFDNVYFRIEGVLTPQQALQYEQAFTDLTEGNLPETYIEWSE